jgi:hypothetical protein
MSNLKMLKLLFLIWPTVVFQEGALHNAIAGCSIVVFKTMMKKWQAKHLVSNRLLNRLMETAVEWQNLHVIIFLGECCNVTVTTQTMTAVQKKKNQNLSVMMAFQLYCGDDKFVVSQANTSVHVCSSLFVLAFMCMPQINPGYIIKQVQDGKWGACSSYGCATCATLMETSNNSELLSTIASTYFGCALSAHGYPHRCHFYSISTPDVVFTEYIQPFVYRLIRPRGMFTRLNFPMFAKKGQLAMQTLMFIFFRMNCMCADMKQTPVAALPNELQIHILTFVRHCDWSISLK